MLCDLIVRNFAIIDELHIQFGPGFNVLSGETGAGKSILIGALQLLLGGRAKTDLIRTGEEEAVVEAIFEPIDLPLQQALEKAGLPSGDELLLKRTVQRNGKNRIYVNGSLVTLAQWQPLGERLVRIYGQHEQQLLQNRDNHLKLLDQYGVPHELLERYQNLYRQYGLLRNQVNALNADERQRQQRIDLLTYQCREIQAANLEVNEEETLEQERTILANSERLRLCTSGGYERLYEGESAAIGTIAAVADDLEGVQGISPELDSLAEALRSVQFQLDDVAGQLRTQGDQLEFDPQRQNDVEERLALLAQMKRKYAPTVAEILEYLTSAEEELSFLTHTDENQDQLQLQLDKVGGELQEAALALTDSRKRVAKELSGAVESHLAELAMDKACFEVRFGATEPGASGCDLAEFYLSANLGEETRPLIHVASGGELSRIMLALRGASPEKDLGGTSIYDEVDAGIGGATAAVVGQKLKAVACGTQVLCITHLPQVASFGDCHYRVEKEENEGRTRTRIRLLDGEERVREMARMLGGAKVTDQTLAHAREMILGSS